MKVVGTIEARMGSRRLPGKTLMKIFGEMTLLECVISRFKLCRSIDEIVVATSTSSKDDDIATWCDQHKIGCFRGSEKDVLDRVAQTLMKHNADIVVQMGADSAYLDYQLIDQLVQTYRNGMYDYVCNDMKLTYPLGIYGHVVNAQELIELNENLLLSAEEREDVVRYIFEHPEQYRILNVEAIKEYHYPALRFTVDYAEDMQQAKEVYSYFGGFNFTTAQLIELYKQQPRTFEKTRDLKQHSAPFIKQENSLV